MAEITFDGLNENSLIMQWNTDNYGNPKSIHINNEVQQVSPTHHVIQLAQIPDEYYRARFVAEGINGWLIEVRNLRELKDINNYYVDYNHGIVYFHEEMAGRLVRADYYGRGVMFLSDTRIFHKSGDSFATTLDEVLEKSEDAFKLLESTGGLNQAIELLEDKAEEGNKVADRLENFITETQFYGYTIVLSREAFVVRAKEDGNLHNGEMEDLTVDVVVYKGAKNLSAPDLDVRLYSTTNCECEIENQKLTITRIDVDCIQAQAIIEIDCGDGLIAYRTIEVTKVFDGVSQFNVEMTNAFHSFSATHSGKIEEEQSVTCEFTVTKANEEFKGYVVGIQNVPSGITHNLKKPTENASSVTFTAQPGTSLPDNASISVVFQFNDYVITKTFAFTKSKQGLSAKSLRLAGNQIIHYENPNYEGTPNPTRTSIIAQVTDLSGTPVWSYLEGEEWIVIDGQNGTNLNLYHNDRIWGTKHELTIKCELDGFSDEITLIKVANGAMGLSSYSVILSNESTTLRVGLDGKIPTEELTSQYTRITAFKGADQITPTSITVPQGDTYKVSVSGSTINLISVDASTSTVNIPIEILLDNAVVINKVWSIAKTEKGEIGAAGAVYSINVEGGTRAITYNQLSENPRPTFSGVFTAHVYENGNDITSQIKSWYWTAQGHFTGTSINSSFTPEIKDRLDESVLNNSVTVTAIYNHMPISYTVPIVVSKDLGGLDWVTDWDSTKVSIKDTEVLTPRLFAGEYNPNSDTINGVAIGTDVLNDGQVQGITGYQNNKVSFLLATDGSLLIGNPFEDNGTGLSYNHGRFVLNVDEMAIAGGTVPTWDDMETQLEHHSKDIINAIQDNIDSMNETLNDMTTFVDTILQDELITTLEKVQLDALFQTVTQEVNNIQAQYDSVINNPYLADEDVRNLEKCYIDYMNAYSNIVDVYNDVFGEPVVEEVEYTAPQEEYLMTNDFILETVDVVDGDEVLENTEEQPVMLVDENVDLNPFMLDTLTTQDGYIIVTKNGQPIQMVTENTLLDFSHAVDILREYSSILQQAISEALLSISENKASKMVEEAKEQVRQEIADVDSALNDLETTMNGSFKTGLIGEQSKAILNERLTQLSIEKKDVDGQYEVLSQNTVLSSNNKQTLGIAKDELDAAHDLLVSKINQVIIDNLITNTELQAVNNLISEYANKLQAYSKVAQECNALIAQTYANAAVAAITDEDVFNKVTNYGVLQGLFLKDEKVYINSEYINTRNFKAVTDDGKETFKIDENGEVSITAKSLAITGSSNLATQDYVNTQIENITNTNITFTLSNEFQIIPTDESYYPLSEGAYSIKITGYKGSSQEITDFTIGTVTSNDAGIVPVVSNIDKTIVLSVSPDAPLSDSNGYVDIPISYDGRDFNKRWSWAVSKQGNQATTVTITGEQFFKYTNNYTGTPTPSQIVLTANVFNSTETGKWQYNDNGAWVDWKDSNGNVITDRNITIKHTSPTLQATNSVFLRYYVDSVFDTYTVARISDGANGNDAQYVTVSGEQVFKYSNNFSGKPTPETIILKATVSNTTETGKWQYMETDGTWTDYTKGGTLVTSKTIDILYNSKIFGTTDAKSMRLRYYISNSLYDEITLVKISDGAKGTDGKNGIDGTNGKDGVSTYFYVRYSANANGSNMTSTPSSSSLYIGVCSTTSATAPTSASSYQWTLIKGSDGKDGTPGAKGDNGKTSYLHIKYSNDGKTFTSNNGEDLGKWIGTYVDFNKADSTSFGSYTWSKYVGENGQDGTDGTDGYTIILTNEAQPIPTTSSRVPLSASTYSTDIVVYQGTTKRTDFTLGTIKSANGITVAKPSNSKINFTVSTGTALSADNGTFTIPITIDGKTFNKTFSWSCSKQGNKGDKGDNGADAMAVYITGEQVFKYANNFTGTPTPETIPLTVTRINTTASGKWQYMDENSVWQDFTQGGALQTGDTLNVSCNSKIFGTTSAKSMRVRYYISNTVYDEITLVKVSDGTNGTNGKDSYTVVLTNENHSFLAGSNGNISTETSTTTKVYAYKGATPVAFTLGTITAPTGMTITDNLATGGRTITFTVAAGTSLANSGTIDIPIIVDGTTYTKAFSWSKALKGANGNAGNDAYTVLLTNENHTFVANHLGVTAEQIVTTDVIAYKGATPIKPTIGTLPSVTGLTLAKSGVRITIKANANVSTLADSGSFDIPITVDGKSFTKSFSWTKVKDGQKGENGQPGTNGTNGTNAKSVDLLASTMVFKSNDGGTTFSPDNITVTAQYQNATHGTWYFSTDGGTTWEKLWEGGFKGGITSTNETTIIIPKTCTLFTDTITSVVFKAISEEDANLYDIITITKLHDVTDLEVGGTNLVINSDFYEGKRTNWSYGKTWTIHTTEKYKDKYIIYSSRTDLTSDKWSELLSNKIVVKKGETFTMSVDIKWQDIPSGEGSSISVWAYDSNKNRKNIKSKTIDGSQDWHRLVLTCTVPDGVEYIRACIAHKRNGGIYATNFKIERGNVATDWSPAPQDTTTEINNKVNTLDTSLNQKAIFNRLTNNGTSQGIYLEDGQLYINGEYIEANTIKVDQLEVGSITMFVEDKVQDSIDNIEIGGRNLIPNSNFGNKENPYKYWRASDSKYFTYIEEGGYILYDHSNQSGTYYQMPSDAIPLDDGTTQVTFSFYVKVVDKSILAEDSAIAYIRFYDNSSETSQSNALSYYNIGLDVDNYVNDTWVRITKTVDVPTTLFCYARVSPFVTKNGKIYWKNFQLEEGNKVTNWSPASQDEVDNLGQEQIFNKLTNNGQSQGIVLENGELYVNGEFINSKNFSSVDNKGNQTFLIDSNGNVHINANTFSLGGKGVPTSQEVLDMISEYGQAENLLLKPNFNDGSLTNWNYSVSTYLSVDTSRKHEGSTSLKLKYTGSSNAVMIATSAMSITKYEAGKTYKVGMWIYVEDKTKLKGNLVFSASGVPAGSTSSKIIDSITLTKTNLVNNKWTQFTFDFTPTVDHTSPAIRINCSSGVVAWVTDFTLQEQGGMGQQQMVDILNGAGDGLYLVDGKLLMNAEYIQTGTLAADLIQVRIDETTNLLPFNYVTMDNAINDDDFHISKDVNGIPFAECDLPIYGGGGGVDCAIIPLGYSNVTVKSGKSYWFSCEYYAYWSNDTKPEDGKGTSTATSGSKVGLGTGDNLNIVLYDGTNVSNMKTDGYIELAGVKDFNASVNIVEREEYAGVYTRTWTRLVGRIDNPANYSGKLYVHLDCSGFEPGGYGYFYLRNLQLTDASVADEAISLDYITQVKEKRIELADSSSYYSNILSVDGISLKNGVMSANYDYAGTSYKIDQDGFSYNVIDGSSVFSGESTSYYSYDGGSSGMITGYDTIFGIGGVRRVGGNREGIFIGVHEGFQVPNSTEYGRADIYTHSNYNTALDTYSDWELLGQKIEPLGLVRRDNYCNITTQSCLCIAHSTTTGGDTYNGTTVFSEAMYKRVGNGQLINVNPSENRIYVGNTNSILMLESAYGLTVNEAGEQKQVVTNGTQYGNVQTNIYTGNSIEIWADSDCSSTSERVWIGAGGNAITITSSGTGQSNTNVKYNGNLMYHDGNVYQTLDNAYSGRDVGSAQGLGKIHTYNLYNKALRNGDGTSSAYGGYWSVLHWGCGQAGSAELAIDWTSKGRGFYMRSLRDTQDNWFNWKRIGNSEWILDSTSDERYKRAISDVSTEDCYNMVRNIELHSYLLLTEEERYRVEKGELDADELFLRTVASEGIHHNLQMGVLAQDMLKYSCGTYVVNQDVLRDENGDLISDRYGIDAYNYASAILGGLQEEIKIRDEQYEELKKENEDLKARLDRLEQLILKGE